MAPTTWCRALALAVLLGLRGSGEAALTLHHARPDGALLRLDRRYRRHMPPRAVANPELDNLPMRVATSLPSLQPNERDMSDDGYVFGADAVDRVVTELRDGRFVLLSEDGDADSPIALMIAAEHAGAEEISFIQKHAKRPQLAMPLDRFKAVYASLDKIVLDNNNWDRPTLSVSTRGIGRDHNNVNNVVRTVRTLLDDVSVDQGMLRCPGAVSLAGARQGGVLRRAGATEAAVELAELAGVKPVILHATLSGAGRIEEFARSWGMPHASTADVVAHMRHRAQIVERTGPPARMPTKFGTFDAHCYRSRVDGTEHIALVKCAARGPARTNRPFLTGPRPALVRVHSECCTGDVFGSLRCDCGPQLESALAAIEADGHGVLLYLRGQEGRGIGLGAKMNAYTLQEQGVDTLDANVKLGLPVDSREYGTGAQILVDLGIRDMRLISNNPKKFFGLAGYGLRITERVASHVAPNPENIRYLRTKEERMGHLLGLKELEAAGDAGAIGGADEKDGADGDPDGESDGLAEFPWH